MKYCIIVTYWQTKFFKRRLHKVCVSRQDFIKVSSSLLSISQNWNKMTAILFLNQAFYET